MGRRPAAAHTVVDTRELEVSLADLQVFANGHY
jgi:hypothetical protein